MRQSRPSRHCVAGIPAVALGNYGGSRGRKSFVVLPLIGIPGPFSARSAWRVGRATKKLHSFAQYLHHARLRAEVRTTVPASPSGTRLVHWQGRGAQLRYRCFTGSIRDPNVSDVSRRPGRNEALSAPFGVLAADTSRSATSKESSSWRSGLAWFREPEEQGPAQHRRHRAREIEGPVRTGAISS